jgi:hypothetical protein
MNRSNQAGMAGKIVNVVWLVVLAIAPLLSRSVQKLGPENVVTRLAASTCI